MRCRFCAGLLAANLFTRNNQIKTVTYARIRFTESAEKQGGHLFERDVEGLLAAGARPRNPGAGRDPARCARPELAHLRIRPPYPSLQGLRVHRDAAVPLLGRPRRLSGICHEEG